MADCIEKYAGALLSRRLGKSVISRPTRSLGDMKTSVKHSIEKGHYNTQSARMLKNKNSTEDLLNRLGS